MTADLTNMMENDASSVSVSDDGLRRVADVAERLRRAAYEVERAEAYLKEAKERHTELEQKTLPDLMTELGLSKFTLVDGTEINVKPFVRASIPKDRQAEAFAWLYQNGHGDLIKHTVSVEVGRDQAAAEAAKDALRQCGFLPNDTENIHWQTLSAFCREQLEKAAPIPLDLLGCYTGRKAEFKTPKRSK